MNRLAVRCAPWLLLAASAVACREEAPAPVVQPKPAPSNADTIPVGPVSGTLLGKPFAVQSARYTLDRRRGYEKLDLSLSSAKAEPPCDERRPVNAPSVWLRRVGPGEPKAEQIRLDPSEPAAWEVHYQVFDRRGWLGSSEATALIVIRDVGPDLKLSGELWACFGDVGGSCVAGRFTADHCPARIDAPVRGTELMERPSADAGLRPADAGEAPVVSDGAAPLLTIEPRTPLLPTYPCSGCHQGRTPDPKRRQLREFHRTRYDELSHGDHDAWCYQCHALENLDRLKMANGQLAGYDESERLCTSCHGDKKEDWERGVHGLTTGDWSGARQRRTCTACHNAHDPKFAPMRPERSPAPARPDEPRPAKGAVHHD